MSIRTVSPSPSADSLQKDEDLFFIPARSAKRQRTRIEESTALENEGYKKLVLEPGRLVGLEPGRWRIETRKTARKEVNPDFDSRLMVLVHAAVQAQNSLECG